MDLRSILQGGDGGRDRGAPAAPSRQMSQPPPTAPPPSAGAPATPIQAAPPHSFRDYSNTIHASPGPGPHDYPPAPPSAHAGPYASPTNYQTPNAYTPGRPAPPPLQPPGANDARSPGSAPISGPSPYRQTPTSSMSASSGPGGAYPFPPQQGQPNSPAQRHQYVPTGGYPSRDSYSSQPGPPGGIPQSHGSVSYAGQQQQQQQPGAQPPTPPVGTPGIPPQQYHQRSVSIQSSSTPTSAHSQHPPYPTPYNQHSPVAASHPQPNPYDQPGVQRHPSQPPTPLGPPTAAPSRQTSAASGFTQPPSPYQQRPSLQSQYSQHPPQGHQTSPPPPPHASIQRMPSNHSVYDVVSESHRRSQSQASRSEREHSMSVSPKTRVPSLPSSVGAGQRPTSMSGLSEPDTPHNPSHTFANSASSAMAVDAQARGRELTPAKRKLDDRDLRPEELEAQRRPPPPGESQHLNGNHAQHPPARPMSQSQTSSPLMARQKKVRYANPPIWAQNSKGKQLGNSRNFTLKKGHGQASAAMVNGNGSHAGDHSVKSEHASRHTSPESTRLNLPSSNNPSNTNSSNPSQPAGEAQKDTSPQVFEGQPFPWEPSIENTRPMEVVSKAVADFIFFNVLNNPNFEEVMHRGVLFEIEAKLGTIIDKSTNDRVYYPISAGECVLSDEARVAFRSAMTEAQHRILNEYLNSTVVATDPRNKRGPARVPIQYKHRREVDRFYELPSSFNPRLPIAVQQSINKTSPLKARVSYEQKTGDVLAKIVKARVADLNIHFPHLPLDCRISVNLEWDWDGPVEEILQNSLHLTAEGGRDKIPDRNKDRLSYKQGFYSIDLTQVTQTTTVFGTSKLEKEHELEVEVDGRAVVEHGKRLLEGRESRYPDLIDGLLDNVRVLARKCPGN